MRNHEPWQEILDKKLKSPKFVKAYVRELTKELGVADKAVATLEKRVAELELAGERMTHSIDFNFPEKKAGDIIEAAICLHFVLRKNPKTKKLVI